VLRKVIFVKGAKLQLRGLIALVFLRWGQGLQLVVLHQPAHLLNFELTYSVFLFLLLHLLGEVLQAVLSRPNLFVPAPQLHPVLLLLLFDLLF